MAAPLLGVGGIFLRAQDPGKLYAWYEKHFGLTRKDGCLQFTDDMREEANRGHLVVAFFKKDDSYFDPAQPAMLNLRVADMDAALASLAEAGVAIDPKRDDYPFGRFAWITDPEGNRVELWQPL